MHCHDCYLPQITNTIWLWLFLASSKKLQRLKLSICPRGIETFDAVTGETLHRVSIYKISYCSADAAHSNVFAFIAGAGRGNGDPMQSSDNDDLICYAFLCAKRKIAYNLTITVAKNFERAYDLWKIADQRKAIQCTPDRLKTLQIKSSVANERNHIENHQTDARKNLLIDFNSDTANGLTPAERQRQLLHSAWVSFDDEPLINDTSDVHPVAGKIFENNLWDMNVLCSWASSSHCRIWFVKCVKRRGARHPLIFFICKAFLYCV